MYQVHLRVQGAVEEHNFIPKCSFQKFQFEANAWSKAESKHSLFLYKSIDSMLFFSKKVSLCVKWQVQGEQRKINIHSL
jgi:hypothetical protein